MKSISSLPVAVSDGQQDIVSWSGDCMRLIHLEILSMFNHPSSVVEASKMAMTKSVVTTLLKARIYRKSTELEVNPKPDPRAGRLREELEAMNTTLEAIERGEEDSNCDFDITWIVSRKAILQDTSKGWMTVRRPSP